MQICLQIFEERFCESENYSVMSISLSIVLDTRRIKQKTNKYPIKLRVTFKRVSRDYQIIYDLSKEDYDKLKAPRINAELQIVREGIKEIQRTAENATKDFHDFTFYEFEKNYIVDNRFFRPRKLKKVEAPITAYQFDFSSYEQKFTILKEDQSKPDFISTVYISYIKKLLQEGRIGSAFNYQDSYYSLKKFRSNLPFAEITVSYLIQYEQWMRNKGCSKSTVGIKLRPLRAIFNEAIEAGIIDRKKCYPFGRRKYQIPTSRNVKKALHLNDLSLIYYHKPSDTDEQKAIDYWLFCYLANGINPKDVAYLKFKNIEGEYLIFERAKTENTTRTDPKPITVYLTEDILGIIQRWGNKNRKPGNYIFPVLQDGLTLLEQHFAVRAFVKFINDRMGRIRQQLGIAKKLTTIVSRHSFSTQLKRSGASNEYIQEALGHADKKTTENYLDSFEKEVKKEFAAKLTAFKHDDLKTA